jgi:hypothetical protein
MPQETKRSSRSNTGLPPIPESPKPQAFSDYMSGFLKRIGARDVVEIGPDVQLRIATNLSPYCYRYSCINFPEDTKRMQGWYGLRKNMGQLENVELIGGNAIHLSKSVPHADVIILHNVLLDSTGNDTELLWKYNREEVECSDEQWNELVGRFNQAKNEGYKEFLKVANPGYIVVFGRPDNNNEFMTFLKDTLKIDPKTIDKMELFYDDSEDKWELFVINNT